MAGILPTTTIERLCADALVDAERQIEARIAERVPPGLQRELEHLLDETVDAGVTRFVWLRQFDRAATPPPPTGCWTASSTCGTSISRREGLFDDVPAHRSRGCAGMGNATSPTGCASSRKTGRLAFSGGERKFSVSPNEIHRGPRLPS